MTAYCCCALRINPGWGPTNKAVNTQHQDKKPASWPSSPWTTTKPRLFAFNRSTAAVRLEMPGRTDRFAERSINAQGFKTGLDGEYLVDSVEQVFTQSGWITTVECNGGKQGKPISITRQQLLLAYASQLLLLAAWGQRWRQHEASADEVNVKLGKILLGADPPHSEAAVQRLLHDAGCGNATHFFSSLFWAAWLTCKVV